MIIQSHRVEKRKRRGTALIVVLVVVVMLSLAAYTFSQLMVSESRASRQFGRDVQSRQAAFSAVEYVAALLSDPDDERTANTYHNPSAWAMVTLVEDTEEAGVASFSLVAPLENDPSAKKIRFGLMNESAKINVNEIVHLDLDELDQRSILLALPNMDDHLADAILDYIDEDTEPREYGAEDDVYSLLNPAYTAKNGPLETIEELLLVDGVTPELLYGEDQNRNGLLDPNEDDGDASLPYDNADGVLDPGWVAFLTTFSRESNLRPDGSPKIHVNESLLTELYDAIAQEYDEELATFITAYRIYGGANVEPLPDYGTGPLTSTGDVNTDAILEALASDLASAIAGEQTGSVTRGGLNLLQGPSTEIRSLYELVGAEVDAEINGSMTTLTSPFVADAESLKFLFENFSTTPATSIDGRININEARIEVLAGLPGMPLDLPDAILAARPVTPDGQPMPDLLLNRTNTGWLLLEGHADLLTMRMLDPFITTGGQVYRMQAIGRFHGPGPSVRVEAVIDASREVPKIISWRDLTSLGTGYRWEQLLQTRDGS